MTGYTTNYQALRATAPQYDDVARQVGEIYRTLVDALEAQGACWGADGQGRAFGQKYVTAALPALQQMSDTHEGLRSMVDGVCSWAKNYVTADDLAKLSAQQLSASADDDPG